MKFSNKLFCITLLLVFFCAFLILHFRLLNIDEHRVEKIISPVEIILDKGTFSIDGLETFDSFYSEKNNRLAKDLGITEDEAFILGNLGKYWAISILQGRKIILGTNNLIYYKFGYKERFINSPFCIKDGAATNKQAFQRQLKVIRRGKYAILDLNTDKYYAISKKNSDKIKDFVVVRKSHIKYVLPKKIDFIAADILYSTVFKSKNYKLIVSDLTTKILPDRNCSSDICKEIALHINQARETIDIAIYGYSSTPKIEQELEKAKKRGVKIRLVYDLDEKGNNIYPETYKILKLIPDNKSDKNSAEVRSTMHNKFYIFDGKTVITGSANLSHTDMSGYNSNSILVIKSPDVAKFYTDEFNQMYLGKFHNDKISTPNKYSGDIKVFFSPEDKAVLNGVLPLIKSAKKYIYAPSFVITEKRVTSELINAHKRGVDVKIIADALNASTKHSKSKELRSAGIQVKAENYAGKMHSKSMIIDGEYLIIGSMNFSNSGENRNDENMIVLHDKGAAEFYKKFFIYQWQKIPDKWLNHTPRAEGRDSIGSCSDGIDNNYDGKTDMEDEACRKF